MNNESYYVEEWETGFNPTGIRRKIDAVRLNAGKDRLGIVKVVSPGESDEILLIIRRDFERWFGKLPGEVT